MAEDALRKLELLRQMYEQDLIPAEEYRYRQRLLLDLHLSTTAQHRTDSLASSHPTRLFELDENMVIGPADSRFLLVREIGGGGMGRIWLARDLGKEALEGGQHVKALKVIAPQLQDHPRALEDLKREAIRAAELSHPNIVNVYGWRQGEDGWLFVVMDYLKGRDLDQILLDEGTPGLNWSRTLELLRPMVAALDHAHREHRLVHRDLKLGNVFVTDRGVVKLLDFGLAYRLRHTSSLLNINELGPSGTVQYLPPEFHIGEDSDGIAQDIYALSCMIYEMLVGDTPYSREASIHRSPDLLPHPPRQLTPAAWQVLCSGFAHRKSERPRSAVELLERLEEGQRRGERRQERTDTQVLHNVHGWSADKVQALQQQTAYTMNRPTVLRDPLKDGGQGPLLVLIPPGEFLMGSPDSEPGRLANERRHRVLLTRPFAIGKYPVTFNDYDRFAHSQGLTLPADAGWGRERRPVIGVDWHAACAYARWLSEQTGARYRLPTEAEWEYAARAGTATPFHTGSSLSAEQANYDGRQGYGSGNRGEYREQTVDVGRFPANAWGLHDCHGNVWEWTASRYEADYNGAEREQVAADDPVARVIRGGSWNNPPWFLRAANRFWYNPQQSHCDIGFRLVREL